MMIYVVSLNNGTFRFIWEVLGVLGAFFERSLFRVLLYLSLVDKGYLDIS